MVNKKNPSADVDRYELNFRLLGLAFALLVVIVAFSTQTESSQSFEIDREIETYDDFFPESEIATTQKEIDRPQTRPPIFVPDPLPQKKDPDDKKEEPDDFKEQINNILSSLPPEPSGDEVVLFPEIRPEFPGGYNAMNLFLLKNLQYPRRAIDENIQGVVYVNFIVRQDGSITDVKVLKPVHPLLDREAIRVIESMPDWKPGIQGNRPVNVSINLPIRFSFRD